MYAEEVDSIIDATDDLEFVTTAIWAGERAFYCPGRLRRYAPSRLPTACWVVATELSAEGCPICVAIALARRAATDSGAPTPSTLTNGTWVANQVVTGRNR